MTKMADQSRVAQLILPLPGCQITETGNTVVNLLILHLRKTWVHNEIQHSTVSKKVYYTKKKKHTQ